MSRDSLAAKSGVNRTTIQNLETENDVPGIDTIAKLAAGMGYTLQELFRLLEQPDLPLPEIPEEGLAISPKVVQRLAMFFGELARLSATTAIELSRVEGQDMPPSPPLVETEATFADRMVEQANQFEQDQRQPVPESASTFKIGRHRRRAGRKK